MTNEQLGLMQLPNLATRKGVLRLAALLATAAWLGGAPGAWATGPLIALSPYENHPNSTVQGKGAGFGAYEAIDIYFDTTDEALAIANANGAFPKIPIPVPASALPGTHYVTAVQRSNGEGSQRVFTVNTDWAQFHFNEKRKGLNAWENVLAPNNVASLDVAWTAATLGAVTSSPAVVGGNLYICSEDYLLYSFNATSGAENWGINLNTSCDSSSAVANGVIYVGYNDGILHAINTANGTQNWFYETGGAIKSSPVVANGVVYFGSKDDNLYAVDATTGATLWTAPTGYAINSSPAVANGVVYVGSEDGNT